ncbi:hypothetical protein FA10DRAFT_123569 [Acaromyces ingoldii]|uniref:Uncharacterized protein n=1 Tax=Acaromyces ingoldii TaxID=215250 RepID=A0A316YML8_9BASI|nr:hypothetical protein FA10DRAFT_123569 [Acaromyces ingoldii]PWN90790.1 hypothetical protein FA10DRAFT_123569 [Acaromyces ingoldii]
MRLPFPLQGRVRFSDFFFLRIFTFSESLAPLVRASSVLLPSFLVSCLFPPLTRCLSWTAVLGRTNAAFPCSVPMPREMLTKERLLFSPLLIVSDKSGAWSLCPIVDERVGRWVVGAAAYCKVRGRLREVGERRGMHHSSGKREIESAGPLSGRGGMEQREGKERRGGGGGGGQREMTRQWTRKRGKQ